MTIPAMTLSALTQLSGLDVLDHLDREMTIPVVSGPQAQGDLLVLPHSLVANRVRVPAWTSGRPVGAEGVELLRSAAGGNPHSLVVEDGDCRWWSPVADPLGLALGTLDTRVVAYLIHPEHGASGIAPGRYVIGRQRERGAGRPTGMYQLVVD